MLKKVIRKQNNSSMCFVCGIHNHSGLKASFYELEDGYVLGLFNGEDIHQSYPKRMHGGIITALLDETVGRAIQNEKEEMLWGVTIELTMKFLKPVPLDETLWVVGKVVRERRLTFEGEGFIYDKNHEILATCQARYMKQAVSSIVTEDDHFMDEQWMYVEEDALPEAFDIPL